MRRHYNGRAYDTETATFIFEWRGGNDETAHAESLYRKRGRGEFFLYGHGEGESKYGLGARIIPLTDKEARAWGEEKMAEDVFARVFEGDIPVDIQKRQVSLYLMVETHEKLKNLAYQRKVPMSALIDEYVKSLDVSIGKDNDAVEVEDAAEVGCRCEVR